MFQQILMVTFAYLIGSCSSAIIISKFTKILDPRLFGSKNPGATNMLRLNGLKSGVLTLLGDLTKAWLPVFLMMHYSMQSANLVALAVFLGHLYPCFFKFKGGKGVASALGILMAFNFYVALIVICLWLSIAKLTRISSLSSLVASFTAPWLLLYPYNFSRVYSIFIIVSFIFYRHQENIYRLIDGHESKIEF